MNTSTRVSDRQRMQLRDAPEEKKTTWQKLSETMNNAQDFFQAIDRAVNPMDPDPDPQETQDPVDSAGPNMNMWLWAGGALAAVATIGILTRK